MGAVARKTGLAIRAFLLAGATASLVAPALAQDDADEELPAASRAVVQPLPSQGSYQLNSALTRLASNPHDVSALLDAGGAALALGDTDAALGFYGKADQLSPNNPRVKAALAGAMVRNEDPFAAIPYFDAAERAGANGNQLAAERGLAYDLVGANGEAQRFYRQALAAGPNDEVARRLALSLAIAGDRKGSEAALLNQIRRNDPAGWRTRAFSLAILGDTEEAVKIATGTMPRDLSGAIVPYLRYMGRLTPAQQAAAANFGHFPRAAQIGRDDPRIARYAALYPRKPVTPAASAVAANTSAATKPGRKRNRKDDKTALAQAAPTRVTPAASPRVAPTPAPTPTPAARIVPPPVRIAAATPNPLPRATPAPTPTPLPSPSVSLAQPVRTASADVATALSSAAPALPAARPTMGPPVAASASSPPPSDNLTAVRQVQQPAVTPAAVTPAPSPPPPALAVPITTPKRDLLASFSDFRVPDEEQRSAVAAVDLSTLVLPRPKKADAAVDRGAPPEAPLGTRRVAGADPAAALAAVKKGSTDKTAKPAAKPAPPSHPSRIWVQVGVGRNKGALAFDWRKLQRAQADLLKGKKGWTTPWGQTNRLLVGPFDTQAAAQAFLKGVKKEQPDAFVWSSPAGQAVDALAAK